MNILNVRLLKSIVRNADYFIVQTSQSYSTLPFRHITSCLSNNKSNAISNVCFKTGVYIYPYSHTILPIRHFHSLKFNNKEVTSPLSDLSESSDFYQRLKSLLGITDHKLKIIIKKYPKILQTDLDFMASNLDFLIKKKVSMESIILNPNLILISPDEINSYVDKVRTVIQIQEFEVAVAFLKLNFNKINEISLLWKNEVEVEKQLKGKFSSRLDFLANMLDTSRSQVADMMAKVDLLFMMPFKRIQLILSTLLDGGVKREDIIQDPWIFTHNIEKMKERLSAANNLPRVKPWMLRTNETKFQAYVERVTHEQHLLQDNNDIETFLKRTLSWSEEQMQDVLKRAPDTTRISVTKLDEMITFLLSQGFTSEHLFETPRILEYSVETISNRLRQLSENKYQPKKFSMITQNSNQFSRIIRRLEENNSNHQENMVNQKLTSKKEKGQNEMKVR